MIEAIDIIQPPKLLIEVITRNGRDGIAGGGLPITNEIPSGDIDGSNVTFVSEFQFVPETVEVFLNGVKQKLVDDYVLSGGFNIILTGSPLSGEFILINYFKF